MDRRVTPPRRVTSPTWGPPPPCKQALNDVVQKIEKTVNNTQITTQKRTSNSSRNTKKHPDLGIFGFSLIKVRVQGDLILGSFSCM